MEGVRDEAGDSGFLYVRFRRHDQCSALFIAQTRHKKYSLERKNINNHNNKEKKPRSDSVYKLPVFSATALNASVFAVISPGWAASEFLRSARPLPHPTSVPPVDAIAETSPPLQLGHPVVFFIPMLPYPSALLFARG